MSEGLYLDRNTPRVEVKGTFQCHGLTMVHAVRAGDNVLPIPCVLHRQCICALLRRRRRRRQHQGCQFMVPLAPSAFAARSFSQHSAQSVFLSSSLAVPAALCGASPDFRAESGNRGPMHSQLGYLCRYPHLYAPVFPLLLLLLALAATHARRHRAGPCQCGVSQTCLIRTCWYSCAWSPVKH